MGSSCAKSPPLAFLSEWEQEENERRGVGAAPMPNSICKLHLVLVRTLEYQMDGGYCIIDNSDKFSQMSFHDARRHLSETEGSERLMFFASLRADGRIMPHGTEH